MGVNADKPELPIGFPGTSEFRPACLKCRYDLTGLGDGVCPECGASFTRAGLRARAARSVWGGEFIAGMLCVWALVVVGVCAGLMSSDTNQRLASLVMALFLQLVANAISHEVTRDGEPRGVLVWAGVVIQWIMGVVWVGAVLHGVAGAAYGAVSTIALWYGVRRLRFRSQGLVIVRVAGYGIIAQSVCALIAHVREDATNVHAGSVGWALGGVVFGAVMTGVSVWFASRTVKSAARRGVSVSEPGR